MDKLAWTPNLSFLDITFASQITDEGMAYFKERKLPVKKLFVTGMTGISANGLSDILNSCRETVRVLDAALLDQESMNSSFCYALSHCFELEEIDLTGDINVGDDGIM